MDMLGDRKHWFLPLLGEVYHANPTFFPKPANLCITRLAR